MEWHDKYVDLPAEHYRKIPVLTIEEAQEARRIFAMQQTDPQVRKRLEDAAVDPAGLSRFTEAIRDCGLRGEWHQYRVRALVDRIANWAKNEGIQWRDDWLTTSSRGIPEAYSSSESMEDSRYAINALLELMDQEDMRRVSIPLDIVLKLIQRQR